MNNILHKKQTNFLEGLRVDLFAGGGGASTGFELAYSRPVDIAINHDPDAIAMHAVNHPYTKHYCENIWDVDPKKVINGRHVLHLHASPDCTHFSKAKGGKPVSKKIRGLAWVILRWAAITKPDIITMENVGEFTTWGPIKRGYPVKAKRGQTFKKFIAQFRALDYKVEWKELSACDYGAPTIRKRLILIARRDGKPIMFPEPTHGKTEDLKPYRTAAEIIDFTIPMKSIFGRVKPLAEATLRRIARGIKKFVLDNPKPFIMQMNYENPPQDIDEPLSTVVTVNHHYVVAPTLIQTGYGEAIGQQPRALDIHKPLGTVPAGGNKFALVAAFMSKYFGGEQAHASELSEPLPTVTAIDHNSLVTVFLDQRYGGEKRVGADITKPLPTITTADHNQLVTLDFITHQYGTSTGQAMDEPLNTVTQVSKANRVSAFLMKYYKGDDNTQSLGEPLHTIRTKTCFYLIKVEGIEYIISDIKMRMLEPRELFNAQGFPPDYCIDIETKIGKRYSKAKQIARCGNAVCPPLAEAVARANMPELCGDRFETMSEFNKEIAI